MTAVTTAAEIEVEEVSSKEELMNQSDSFEDKLMHKQSRGFNNGDTSSTKSEHNSVKAPASVCSNDGSDDSDFWM
jgi:hypothetical protein